MATRTAYLVQRVLSNIGDEGTRRDTREKVLREMDRVQLDVCRRGYALKGSRDLQLGVGVGIYDLGGTVHRITNVIEPVGWTTALWIVNDPQMWREKKRNASVISSQFPVFGRVFAGRLELFPGPSVAEILSLDLALLPENVLDEDEDPEVETKWDDCLEYGTTANMKKEGPDGDWTVKFEAKLLELTQEGMRETTVEVMRRRHRSDNIGF